MTGVETIAKVGRDHFVHGKGIKQITRERRLSRYSWGLMPEGAESYAKA